MKGFETVTKCGGWYLERCDRLFRLRHVGFLGGERLYMLYRLRSVIDVFRYLCACQAHHRVPVRFYIVRLAKRNEV